MRDFASKMRRTGDRLAYEHKCDRVAIRWLVIAWAKREGNVPLSLNRTDRIGREIPLLGHRYTVGHVG